MQNWIEYDFSQFEKLDGMTSILSGLDIRCGKNAAIAAGIGMPQNYCDFFLHGIFINKK